MFLRCTERKKDGKVHYYYSVVENRRVADNKVTQRTVLYLGEINQLQEAAWQDLLNRFEGECQGQSVKPFRQPRLLGPPPVRPQEVDAIQVKLSQMELRRPRAFGNCWLGCTIWRLLELDRFLALFVCHVLPGRRRSPLFLLALRTLRRHLSSQNLVD